LLALSELETSGHAETLRRPALLPRRWQSAVLLLRIPAAGGRRRFGVSDFLYQRPRRVSVPLGQSDTAHRKPGRSVSRAEMRNASAACRTTGSNRRRCGPCKDAPGRNLRAGIYREDDPAGYGFRALSLAR